MIRVNWTLENVTKIALGCKNKRELQIKYPGAYKAAVRLGLLNKLFVGHSQTQWTDEMLAFEATKYTSRGAFATGSPSAYVTARRRRLLDTIAPPRAVRAHTEASLKLLANTYETRTDFAKADPGAYSSAQRAGLLDAVCPPNVGGTSKGEQSLLAFLKSLAPDFQKKRFGNTYEIDCYSETLGIGVEYNGLYWHSEANTKMGTQYHLKKTRYFENVYIRVIHIWEHEWATKTAQVQNYLRSACGVNKIRIGARKCEFKAIDAGIARSFLDLTHMQGRPNHIELAIGCFYKGTLISVATFGKHHRRAADGYVLNRFACLADHTVSGALAKMSNIAYNKLGPLKSWADYSKSQAVGYIAAGWVKTRVLGPDYFYTDKRNNVITKQSRKKSTVGTPFTVTEAEHAKRDGLYRIWDCGKIVLIYDQNKKKAA